MGQPHTITHVDVRGLDRAHLVLSLAGLPVASVPCGLDPGGLPVGLQIVGRPRPEGPVLDDASAMHGVRPIGLPGG